MTKLWLSPKETPPSHRLFAEENVDPWEETFLLVRPSDPRGDCLVRVCFGSTGASAGDECEPSPGTPFYRKRRGWA